MESNLGSLVGPRPLLQVLDLRRSAEPHCQDLTVKAVREGLCRDFRWAVKKEGARAKDEGRREKHGISRQVGRNNRGEGSKSTKSLGHPLLPFHLSCCTGVAIFRSEKVEILKRNWR